MNKKVLLVTLLIIFGSVLCSCSLAKQNIKTIEGGSTVDLLSLITVDEGYTAVVKEGTIDTKVPGKYTVTYTLTKKADNSAKDIRFDFAVEDTTPPVVKVSEGIQIAIHSNFDPLDYLTITDNCDENFTAANITVDKTIDTSKEGTSELSITVMDSSKNETNVKMTVVVSSKNLLNISEIENTLLSSEKLLKARFGDYQLSKRTQDGYKITTYTFASYGVKYELCGSATVASGMDTSISFYKKNTGVFGIILGKTTYFEAKKILTDNAMSVIGEDDNNFTTELDGVKIKIKGQYNNEDAQLPYTISLYCDDKDVVQQVSVGYGM